eukprot:jgi/Picsp_1/4291/NSC_01800-R1_protein vps54
MANDCEIQKIQRELAEISISNGLLQTTTWKKDVYLELEDVEHLPALSSDVLPEVSPKDFSKYLGLLESHSGIEWDVKNIKRTVLCEEGDGEEISACFFRDLFDIDSSDVWDSVKSSSDASWDPIIDKLTKHEELVTRKMMRLISNRGEEFEKSSVTIGMLSGLVSDFTTSVRTKRSEISNAASISKNNSEICMNLGYRKKNLQNLLCTCLDIKTILNLKEALEATLSSTEKIGMHYFEAIEIYDELTSQYNSNISRQIRGLGMTNSQISTYNSSLRKMLSNRLEGACRDAIHQSFDSANQTAHIEEIKTLAIHSKNMSGPDGVKEHMHRFIQDLVEQYFLSGLMECGDAGCQYNTLSSMIKHILEIDVLDLVFAQFVSQTKMLLDVSARLDDTTNIKEVVEVSFLVLCTKGVLHCWETIVASWGNKVVGWNVSIDHLRLLLKYTDTVSEMCQSRIDSSKLTESGSISECVLEACKKFLNGLQQKHVQQITDYLIQDIWRHEAMNKDFKLMIEFITIKQVGFGTAGDADYLKIKDREFGIVKSMKPFIAALYDLKNIALHMDAFSTDVAHRVIELFRLFNGKTCQLVLGAGAMQTAGLKSISVKHLAISCEQIDLLLLLSSFLRKFFSEKVSSRKQLLLNNEFDRVQKDLTLHKTEVCQKIVSIANEMIVPLMKEASIVLLSFLRQETYKGHLEPRYKDLIDTSLQKLRLVTGIVHPTLSQTESQFILNSIMQESTMWLKDGLLSIPKENAASLNGFTTHLDYLFRGLEESNVCCKVPDLQRLCMVVNSEDFD